MQRLDLIVSIELLGGYRVRVGFADGVVREVDLEPFLTGPIFAPVRDPAFFRRAFVDGESGTIAWLSCAMRNAAASAPRTSMQT